jgi:uncharacterized protein YbbK (DUF523 family)
MELRRKGGATIVVRSGDGLDSTVRLQRACLRIARDVLTQGIQGAIVKSRSPSCAVGGAPLFSERGDSPHLDGVGLLVRALRGLAPDLPVIDELAFEDGGQRTSFFLEIGIACF